MAAFPPNLDDGELWLPSNIFLSEVPSSKYDDSNSPCNRYRLSCMNDVARHIAALSLLQSRRPKHAPNLQRVKPAVRNVSVSHLPGGSGAELGGQRLHGYGTRTGPIPTRSDPFFEFQVSPTPEVDSYLEMRATRVLQLATTRFRTRVYPFQGSGFGSGGGGGFVRESGGTGVFHPKPTTNTAAATAAEVKKRPGWRNRKEIQITQHRDSINRVGVSKQEDCYYHLPPPEMGLPRDWTY